MGVEYTRKAEGKGVEFQGGEVRILEVCNPHKAKDVLEKDINVVYFLPCKVVIYEDKGTTKIGMVRPTVLIDLLESEELRSFALEVETTIKNAVETAK